MRIGSVYILTPLQHVARRVKEAQIIRFEPAHRPGHTLRVQRKPRISIQKFVAFAVRVRRHRARTGGILKFGFRRKAVACQAQHIFLREHRGAVTVLAFFVTPLFLRNALLLAEEIAIRCRSMPIDPNRGQIRQAAESGWNRILRIEGLKLLYRNRLVGNRIGEANALWMHRVVEIR